MLGMGVLVDTSTNTLNLTMDSMNPILKYKIKLQRKYTEMLQRG